jgi:hypothetical protein
MIIELGVGCLDCIVLRKISRDVDIWRMGVEHVGDAIRVSFEVRILLMRG